MSELISIRFQKILQSRAYTVLILGNEEKKFAIYMEPSVGKNIQTHIIAKYRPRPYTHELIVNTLKGLNIEILQVVINDLEDTVYFARLYLKQTCAQQETYLEIDARPSDCLSLALLENVPLYCTKEVFEKAIPTAE